ncbi:Sucrase/ferredoxin-like-domain-containing protein [Mycena amicta]|nr:Sucrase/ferredoxin-like-domain-containing protein [Mycena amicta]
MSLRRLRALVLGEARCELDKYASLSASGIPIALGDCRSCPNPCDEGHAEYPRRFVVDHDSTLLGSMKPFRRQILISTGKSDWDYCVTETPGSLAALIAQTQPPTQPESPAPIAIDLDEKAAPLVPGVFTSSDSTRLSILNGSHKTVSAEQEEHTVVVLPDYTIIVGVRASVEDATELWRTALDASLPRLGLQRTTFSSYVLPFACVILLCSHKRRDNRCAISAPKLEHAFIRSLEAKGWTAHTELEHIVDPPLEKFSGTVEEKERHVADELRTLPATRKALILRNSHIGGHHFSGNCVLYLPSGSCVWYGRVTPHEVESIVENTILGGLVLPTLLRGGMDIMRPGCPTLHDW